MILKEIPRTEIRSLQRFWTLGMLLASPLSEVSVAYALRFTNVKGVVLTHFPVTTVFI